MVAIVSGNSLGLNLGSLAVLGTNGRIGNAAQGHNGEGAYVNAATGNLVLQDLDGLLMGVGPNVASLRTYNSQGHANFTNNDGWQNGQYKSVVDLGGGVLQRTDSDGSTARYDWDATSQSYVSEVATGSAANRIVGGAGGTFVWTSGATGATETYAGTGTGLIQSSADPSGNALSYTYNGSGLLTQVTDADGESVRYTYSGQNLVGLSTVLAGGQTLSDVTYTYDAQNRLITVSVNLDPAGDLPAGSETLSNYVTHYIYDGTSDRIASITQSDGTSQSFTYVLSGGSYKVATTTDGLGHTTSYSYDSAAGKTTVTDALGASSVYRYDTSGQLLEIRTGVTAANQAGLSQLSYTYNALGDVATMTDGVGHVVTMGYDANGNLTSTVDGAGDTHTSTYNAANQLLTDTSYAAPGTGSQAAAIPEITRYVYAASQPTQLRFVISAQGDITEYRYSTNGQRTATLNYAGGTYDTSTLGATDVPTEAQMQTWQSTQDLTQAQRVDFTYDFRGQLTGSITYASLSASGDGVTATASTTHYVYDQRGELRQSIAPNSATVSQFVYDGLGRLVSSSGPSLDGSTPNVTLTNYDDANGKTTLTQANGLSTQSTYDQAGRLVSVIQSGGSNANLGTTTYAYDADGQLLMAQDPTGVRRWTMYDAAGRKIADIDATGAMTEYVYNADNQLTEVVAYATPIDTAPLLDANGAPTTTFGADVTLDTLRPATTPQDETQWNLYDAAGRLAWQVDARGHVTETTYDGDSRVLAVTHLANPIDVSHLGNGVGITISITGDVPAATTESSGASPVVVAQATLDAARDRTTTELRDSDGRLTGTINGEGYLTAFTYNSAGRLTETVQYANPVPGFSSAASIAGLVETARASHSLAGLLPATDAADIHTRALYNARGQQVGQIDGDGYLTETVYDANGNVMQSIRYATVALTPAGTPTLASVRPASTPADQVIMQTWNAANELLSRTAADGTMTHFSYNAVGQLVRSTVAVGTADQRTLTERYDLQGRLVGELGGVGSALLTGNQTQAQIDAIWAQYGITHSYDAAGRRTSTTDALGHWTLFFYDQADRLNYTVDALGEVTETRYNALGQLTNRVRYGTAINPSGLTGGLVNNALNNALNAVRNPGLDSDTQYVYDSVGALSSTIDPLGAVSTLTHDAFGDVEQTTRPVQPGQTVTSARSYDRRGLQTGAVADTGGINATRTTQYDAFGRVIESVDANGNVTRAGYDALGRVVSTTDATGATRGTTYDAFGRVLTQTNALGVKLQ